jgi:hypothetical protein
MSSTKVRLRVTDLNLVLHDTEIPDDATVRDLITDIADQLSLPLMDGFGSIKKYQLGSETLGRSLSDDETLTSAGVPPDDTLILASYETPGGVAVKPEGRIKFDKSSIGLSLDDLAAIDTRTLLANEPALMMTLHSYKASLTQLEDSRQDLRGAEEEIRRLNERLKEKNIATVLLLLGQIQIGFGTNLITNGSSGGWFVFLAGLAVNVGAIFFSFFGYGRRVVWNRGTQPN